MLKFMTAGVAGLVVGGVVFFAFGLYTWTAIHSGWSLEGIQIFHLATVLVPVLVGAVTAVGVYRFLRSGEGKSM